MLSHSLASTLFPYTTLFRSRMAVIPDELADEYRKIVRAHRATLSRLLTRSRIDYRACSTDRKSTRLNSSHLGNSYAVFCLKKKNKTHSATRQDASIQQAHTP